MGGVLKGLDWRITTLCAAIPLALLGITQFDWSRHGQYNPLNLAAGFIGEIETLIMDYRFRFRGPIPAPLRTVYIGQDISTFQHFGQELFPREAYARCIDAAFNIGGARALFLDIILNRTVFQGGMIQREAWLHDVASLRHVLASDYRGMPLGNRVVLAARLPLTREEALAGKPDIPLFPFWAPYGLASGGVGRIGSINVAYGSGSDVPRHLPGFIRMAPEPVVEVFAESLEGWLNLLEPEPPAQVRFASGVLTVQRGDERMLERPIPGEPLTIYPAALEMLLAAHLEEWPFIEREDGFVVVRAFSGGGEARDLYRVPLWGHNVMDVNWFAPWVNPVAGGSDDSTRDPHNPKITMLDLLQQLDQLAWLDANDRSLEADAIRQRLHALFHDAYVLIGPTDPVYQDVGPTPFERGNVPRVSVHGNMVKTIASGLYIRHLPAIWNWILTLGLTALVWGLMVKGGRHILLARACAVLAMVIYVLLAMQAFRLQHAVVPVVLPVGAALSTGLVGLLAQLITEERQRSRIKGLFGTYLSPELVNRMVESGEEPQLGGHTEDITAFFSDIQGFSSFSEVLDPPQLVDLMNAYLDAMTVILEDQGGTLDKYIGDAIVGIFGAPVRLADHAHRACLAAWRMQCQQAELRARWLAEGERWPPLVHHMRTRIGLHTGTAIVGNMGSTKRFNYTMMGDTVNLAARNESAAKSYGVYIMVSGDTRAMAEAAGSPCVFRFLDRIVVKGRTRPVDVFEIVGEKGELTAAALSCLAAYAEAVEAYLRRDWARAREGFTAAAQFEPHQPDPMRGITINPSLLMLERCAWFAANPPPDDWDGRYIMKSK